MVGQRHDAKARGAVKAGPFHDVTGEVRGRRRAASIATDEDVAPVGARFAEQLDGLIHFVQLDGFNRFEQLAFVLLRKSHFALNSPVSARAP